MDFLKNIKNAAFAQEKMWGEIELEKAKLANVSCPNCGGNRDEFSGLKNCPYCWFEYNSRDFSDGIFIKKIHNSKR